MICHLKLISKRSSLKSSIVNPSDIHLSIDNKPEKLDSFLLGGIFFETRLRPRTRGALGDSNTSFFFTKCLTNITCERSRASRAIRPTLKTVHLQLSALSLATRPLATARPCHARPTQQPSVSPAMQRPTSPNSASGGHEKPLLGTARALPRKVENRKKVQSHRAPAVLLHCCCTAVVVPLLLLLLVTTAFVSKNKKSAFCGHDLA